MDHHRVAIRNTTDQPIGYNTTVELDGKPVYVTEATVRLDANGLTTVTLTLPATVELDTPALVEVGIDLVQPPIAEVKRVQFGPGDTVVLETTERWPDQMCDRARVYLSTVFPNNEVAVVAGGTLKVVKKRDESAESV